MKVYIDAELAIVRMQNDIIATSMGLNNGQPNNDNPGNNFGPARKSIWD